MTPCEHCGERPAVIHLKTVAGGETTEQHLCEECAAERGVQTEASLAKFPLGDFLASMGKAGAAPAGSGRDATRCEGCGATLQDFRDTGRLGCPRCYQTFETHLRTLLRRVHGASQHVGAAYEPPEGSGTEAASVAPATADGGVERLREALRRAVDAENFELAARLRDQIRARE